MLAGAAFAAGLARGFSGFGAALIFMPIASSLILPRQAAPILLIIDAVLTIGFLPGAWRGADKREVATMAIGALVGVPTGAWILTTLDPLTLRWAIAIVIALLLALLASGWRYRGTPRKPLTIAVGAVAGVFSGATQAGGPPVIAYWLGSPADARRVRSNVILYFEVQTVLTIVSYTVGGVFVAALVPLALLTAPSYGLGLFAGSRLFGKASEPTFRRIAFSLIGVALILGLPVLDGILR